MGSNIKSLNPLVEKKVREQGTSLRLGNGRVYFRAKADWLHEFEKGLLEFSNGKYDDQVEAFAYIDKLSDNSSSFVPVDKKSGIMEGF